jgi:hypothetical protein
VWKIQLGRLSATSTTLHDAKIAPRRDKKPADDIHCPQTGRR